MGKKSILYIIFISTAFLSAAQESNEGGASGQGSAVSSVMTTATLPPVPLLPVEAPKSLLSMKLGDSDVELTAKGYWEASFLASGALGFGANSGASSPTFLFSQTPDLWLSLVLMEKWFLEATLSADGSGDGYAAGYRGGEGDFLKEVRIGNKDVSFPELPYLSMGSGTSSSFGLAAYGMNDNGSAHFLLRYDQARRATQTWVGDKELTETTFKPSEYLRGQFFVLPADTSVTHLELYIQSSSGTLTGSDGNTYREMAQDEYSLSASKGRLDLKEALGSDRRLLVYYDSMTVPAVTTGAPFYGRAPVTVTGVTASGAALVLYEEGEHEGFLIANRYTLPSSVTAASAAAYVEDAATGLTAAGYTATVLADGFIQVVKSDSSDPQSDDFSRPFVSEMDWLYNPEATQTDEDEDPTQPAPAYSKLVILDSYGTSGDFVLEDTGVLPGSIEVRRDGVLDYDFTYNEDANTVKLAREPGLSETIEISYLLSSTDRSAGSLAAALGGIYQLSPDWKAWTALGLRWGVPGTGYSTGSEATPGSLTLTAGFRGGTPEPKPGETEPSQRFRAEAALAGSYMRQDAVGYYRAAGMEDSTSWTSPFRGTTDSSTYDDVAAVEDAALKPLFPKTYARFHSESSTQKALDISFHGSSGSDAEFVRYVDPIAAGDYRTFAFFARKDGTTELATPTLTVTISGDGNAVSVEVPLAYVVAEWRRFLVRYDGVPRLYVQTEEEGAETLISAVTPTADPSKSAGKLSINVTGVTDGSVFVDEIYFQDPVGEFSLSGRGKIAWGRTGTVAAVSGHPVLTDPDVTARLSGTLAEDSSAAGYLDGSVGVGPFRVSLNARQGITDGSFSDGSFGHGVKLPLKNLQLQDTFEYSPYSSRFGRYDMIALKAGDFSLKLDQSAAYANEALEQEWNLKLAAGSVFSLTGYLENVALGELDLPSSYAGAWGGAFRYALPALENASARRRTEVQSLLKVKGGLLSASAQSVLLNAASAVPDSTNTAQARLGWSFPVGKGSIEPYYNRSWSLDTVESNSSFSDDWSYWAESFSRSDYLYRSVPFLELWDDATLERFASFSSDSQSAEYSPEAGIVMSRRYGSKWTDLLIPSKGTIAVRRVLQSDLDTVTDALVGEISATAAAVNLFGAQGAYRLSNLYSVDEFSQRLSADITLYREDGKVLTTLTHKAQASFYASKDASFVAENRAAVTETRDGTAWSEQLALTLTTKPSRTWLSDLMILALDSPGRDKSGESTDDSGPNMVSGYLNSLRGAPRKLTEVWGFSGAVKRPYAYLENYGLEFDQSYTTKLVTPEKLSLSAGLEMYQRLDISSGLNYWTFGVELTLTMRVMF